MGTTILILAGLAFIIPFIVKVYNLIINKTNSVERAWADVVAQERQKNKIIPNLQKAVEQYAVHEQSLFTNITELRSSLNRLSADKIDIKRLANTELKTTSLLNNLYAITENYPTLKASEIFNNLMKEIIEQQENVGASIRIFNRNVEDFNNTIETFPNSIINGCLNKKERLEIFKDIEAEDGFDYKLNRR